MKIRLSAPVQKTKYFFADLCRNMIASKLVNILFQNVSLYTEVLTNEIISLVGYILIATDDAFSIKQNVLK